MISPITAHNKPSWLPSHSLCWGHLGRKSAALFTLLWSILHDFTQYKPSQHLKASRQFHAWSPGTAKQPREPVGCWIAPVVRNMACDWLMPLIVWLASLNMDWGSYSSSAFWVSINVLWSDWTLGILKLLAVRVVQGVCEKVCGLCYFSSKFNVEIIIVQHTETWTKCLTLCWHLFFKCILLVEIVWKKKSNVSWAVMAWFNQVANHYLIKIWGSMMLYGNISPR